MVHCSLCCFLVWCPGFIPGVIFLGIPPLAMYLDQCHAGRNTVKLVVQRVELLGKTQDADGEDELQLQLESGLCGHGSLSVSEPIKLKKGGSVDVKDKGGFSRHAFFDYPIEVRLAETDFFSPDGAKPLTIDAETMKKIHTVLETGSVKSISLTHVFTISENLVSFVTGNIYGGKEGACIDTLDFASGKAETAVTALRTGQGVAQALSKAGVSQADGTADGLNKVLDVFKVCSDDLKGIAKTLGGKVGGDAAYLVTMKAERADSNKCRRSQSCSTLTLLLMSFGIVLHVTTG